MASIRKKLRVSGKTYYEIRVSQGRGKPYLSRTWEPPDGWSDRSIKRELSKIAAEFEASCRRGEVLTRQEKASKYASEAVALAAIPTVREFGETVFMPQKSLSFSENSRTSYQTNLNIWVYPHLGDSKLPEVTPAQISALLTTVQAQRSHGTAVKVYVVLSSLFKMAYKSGAIEQNPLHRVDRPKSKKGNNAKSQTYSVEELTNILSLLENEPLKWQTYVHILASTGIRRGEACALQWDNIDFHQATATISDNLCYTPAKGVYLDSPKNGRSRTVILPPTVLELLNALRSESKSSCGFVFTQKDGVSPIHPQSPTRYLKKFAQRHNIPDLHPHKLRHTFASIGIEQGATITGIADALGHQNTETTIRTYVHGSTHAQRAACESVHAAIYGDEFKRNDNHEHE